MDDVTVTKEKTLFPFPESDYDKDGKLKRVRKRVLKNLLKYEFKAILKPLMLSAAILLALASYLFAFGFLIDFSSDTGAAKYVLWILTMVIFVYGSLFMLVFPIIVSMRRYSRNFFGSDGYLALSIPATPEEQILAKRISQYVAVFGAMLVVFSSVILVLFPLGLDTGMFDFVFPPMDGGELTLFIFEQIHAFLEFHILPLFLVCLFSFLKCWRHRGLRAWGIVLMCVGVFFTFTYGAALVATLVEEGIIVFTDVFLAVLDWIGLVLQCVAIYGIWRYETTTLRCKINLK